MRLRERLLLLLLNGLSCGAAKTETMFIAQNSVTTMDGISAKIIMQ